MAPSSWLLSVFLSLFFSRYRARTETADLVNKLFSMQKSFQGFMGNGRDYALVDARLNCGLRDNDFAR